VENLLNDREQDKTEAIRATLYFLQFIENKIICKQVYKLTSYDMPEVVGFQRFIREHLK